MDVIKIEDEPDIGPTEFIFETIDLPIPSKNISIWSNGETKQLIDLYKDFILEVGPLKRFRHKKDMWNEISLRISTKNSKQCEDRFKTLLRRKKKGIEKVCISETKRKLYDLDETNDEKEFQIITKHIRLSENKTDDCSTPFKQLQVWSNYETKLLVELYNRLICEVGPRKRLTHKKDMWTEISTNFLNKDSKQCEQRYKTILKRKKSNLTKTVYISKARRKTIDFKAKDSADNTLKIKRFYALTNKVTNDKSKIEHSTKEEAITQKTATIPDSKEVLTISETLLEIAAKKEKGREWRHREKMEVFEKMQNILQNILNSTKNNTNF